MSKNLSAKCYQENKERLRKKARERYQNLFKKKKEKKVTIWSLVDNMLVEYRKKYYRMRKNALL